MITMNTTMMKLIMMMKRKEKNTVVITKFSLFTEINVPIQKFSFPRSKSQISFLVLFWVLVTESIEINFKYLDGLIVSVEESMEFFTTEHSFTFYFMCDL